MRLGTRLRYMSLSHTHKLVSSPDFWVSLYAYHGCTPCGVSILRIPLVLFAITKIVCEQKVRSLIPILCPSSCLSISALSPDSRQEDEESDGRATPGVDLPS